MTCTTYSASVVVVPDTRSCCARRTVSTAVGCLRQTAVQGLLFSSAPASPDAETVWSAQGGSSSWVLLAISARSLPNMSAELAKVCELATLVASAVAL
ncbi:Choline dehydrogenase [Purpureocillium takamizusanense]|uniref:Choline dehydrogenase n=1 Tax=Purpureocillium takamizusanense TaxID=2060973 RepID=A0A9Q8QGC9_9HYPO|nr:Choline dehydrogenase [Purpureocillium takamizusanense]UNI19388.1 Choline dehydrogenase [Purpureocillium takamizusanense]